VTFLPHFPEPQLADETKVFDEKKTERMGISFTFIIDEPTKTIRLDVSESRIQEKYLHPFAAVV
jgi:hypothetical protein